MLWKYLSKQKCASGISVDKCERGAIFDQTPPNMLLIHGKWQTLDYFSQMSGANGISVGKCERGAIFDAGLKMHPTCYSNSR